MRARKLAELGYVALAVDMYGAVRKRQNNPGDAAEKWLELFIKTCQ